MEVVKVLKLMKLEMQKFELVKYMRGAFIANIVIVILLCLIGYVEMNEEIKVMTTHYMAIQIIETIIRATFIIFAAVLLSQMVINEFKSKTITVLFMYPISRKKILLAKLLITIIFTFSAIVLSFIFVSSGFYLFNHFTQIIPEPFNTSIVINYFGIVLLNALAASLISLIPLYVGMRKYSISATIITSFFISIIVCQNFNGFSLNSIIFIPIILSILGGMVAILTIKDIDDKDIIA